MYLILVQKKNPENTGNVGKIIGEKIMTNNFLLLIKDGNIQISEATYLSSKVNKENSCVGLSWHTFRTPLIATRLYKQPELNRVIIVNDRRLVSNNINQETVWNNIFKEVRGNHY